MDGGHSPNRLLPQSTHRPCRLGLRLARFICYLLVVGHHAEDARPQRYACEEEVKDQNACTTYACQEAQHGRS